MKYLYIAATVFFTVYGQLVIKWQVSRYGDLPDLFQDKIVFLLKMLLNPWIVTGFAAAFLAALSWMAAMTKFELSHAYPFTGLVFVLLMIFSGVLFHEPITWQKIVGTGLVVLGIIVVGQG